MTCPSCGLEVQPGQRFCAGCGTRLSVTCASCGTTLPTGARFCPDCGTPTDQTVRPARTVGGGPLDSALEPAPQVAERRLVSVLFCDLVGFTTASEGRDAEETRELLTAYYELARERVERYGGTIEKFIGDAVMAVWGVPTAREDDAERAVRAALDLVSAVPRLVDAAPATGAAPLAARAGVLTGEAAVTLEAQGQGMVAGDLVNTASRLQSAAPPGSVLVGEATHAATDRAIAYEPMGETELRGRSAPVSAWRAVRAIALVGGRYGSDELEPPFVGRESELRFLTEMYHAAARERRLRLVSVTGQGGIGKSRLARELERYLDGIAETVHWHRGRCPAYGQGVTFWAVGEMVRRRAGIAETDDPATTAERLRAMLAEYVPDGSERERIEPALRALLGLDTRGWSPSDTGELYVAWRTLFERIAGQGPVVLVFEDLQWADEGLVGFIQHLLEWSRTQPILVVTLARPEFVDAHPTWGAGLRNFASLHLEPLPDTAVIAMLEGLIPGIPGPAARAIAARAEGVPLYAVETVRMLLAQGILRRDGATLHLAGDIGAVAIPDSLRGLVAARLDTLPAAERSLLQDAAVLGQSFGIDLLAAVAGSSPTAIEPGLHDLVRRELLRLEADPRSPERGQYQWVQAVIREVAYATLSRRDRRAKHLAAARFLDTSGGEEAAAVLADHYLEAFRASIEGPEADALAGQARVALRAAADRAERLRNWRQAAALVERALDVTADPGERPALLEHRADLLTRTSATKEAEAAYREALAAVRAGGDLDAIARLEGQVAGQIMVDLRIPEAIAYLERAVAELGPGLDTPGRIALEGQLGRAYFLGQDERATPTLERTIEAAEAAGLEETLIQAIVSLGTVGVYTDRLSGIAMLFGSVELARRAGLVDAELRALNNVGAWALEADPPLGSQTLERILAICDRTGIDPLGWLADRPYELLWRDGLAASLQGFQELAERVAPGSREEYELLQGRMGMAALAGDEATFEELRARLSSEVERGPELTAWHRWAVGLGLALLGRTDEAAAMVGEHNDIQTTPARIIVALLRRDRAALERAVVDLGDRTLTMGPLRRGLRGMGRAGLVLMEREDDAAVAAYVEGLELSMGGQLAEAVALSAIALTGLASAGRQDVRRAVGGVRAELERIGAVGALRRLDETVAASEARAAAATPRPRGGVAERISAA